MRIEFGGFVFKRSCITTFATLFALFTARVGSEAGASTGITKEMATTGEQTGCIGQFARAYAAMEIKRGLVGDGGHLLSRSCVHSVRRVGEGGRCSFGLSL